MYSFCIGWATKSFAHVVLMVFVRQTSCHEDAVYLIQINVVPIKLLPHMRGRSATSSGGTRDERLEIVKSRGGEEIPSKDLVVNKRRTCLW